MSSGPAQTVDVIATLSRCERGRTDGRQWQWDVGDGSCWRRVHLQQAPSRCLDQLHGVDRVTESSVANYTVPARYEAAEALLDGLWATVVGPVAKDQSLPATFPYRLPRSLLRLPLAAARDRSTGESLVHLTEPILRWVTSAVKPASTPASTTVIRLDGHFRSLARQVAQLRVEPNTTVLAMGCRTAELIPLLADTGARWAVTTAWDVEDRHCGPIADRLESLLANGLGVASAVRSVQAALSHCHPYQWAGYMAVDFQ